MNVSSLSITNTNSVSFLHTQAKVLPSGFEYSFVCSFRNYSHVECEMSGRNTAEISHRKLSASHKLQYRCLLTEYINSSKLFDIVFRSTRMRARTYICLRRDWKYPTVLCKYINNFFLNFKFVILVFTWLISCYFLSNFVTLNYSLDLVLEHKVQ